MKYYAVVLHESGDIEEVHISCNDMTTILDGCSSAYDTLQYLDQYGYKLCLFGRDQGRETDMINKLASELSLKHKIKNEYLYGPTILLGDHKKITKDEFKKIMESTKKIDYVKYKKEGDVELKKFLSKMSIF